MSDRPNLCRCHQTTPYIYEEKRLKQKGRSCDVEHLLKNRLCTVGITNSMARFTGCVDYQSCLRIITGWDQRNRYLSSMPYRGDCCSCGIFTPCRCCTISGVSTGPAQDGCLGSCCPSPDARAVTEIRTWFIERLLFIVQQEFHQRVRGGP